MAGEDISHDRQHKPTSPEPCWFVAFAFYVEFLKRLRAILNIAIGSYLKLNITFLIARFLCL
jgi:hypothetical protein